MQPKAKRHSAFAISAADDKSAHEQGSGRRWEMSFKNVPEFLQKISDGEMSDAKSLKYSFRSFHLDVVERLLLKDKIPIPLSPKVFDVLVQLVTRSGHLVRKDELLEAIWPENYVDEANLARAIHTLRKALGDDQNGNKLIETVAKMGYRFVADTVAEPNGDHHSKAPDLSLGSLPVASTSELEAQLVQGPPRGYAFHPTTLSLKIGAGLVLFSVAAISIGTWLFTRNPSVRSIAILPLRSLNAESRDPAYEMGIANTLILKLRSAKGLEVRPVSVTQAYADKNTDPVTAGREQGVDFVLASEYQIADDKIRISSRLINISSGTVEAEFSDEQVRTTIFAIQDEVAANIGNRLLRRMERVAGNDNLKEYTTNEEAYRYYWLGKSLAEKQNLKDAEKAIRYLEQAVALDPNYALAYATLADVHGIIAMSGGDKREHYIKQRSTLEKALAIDAELPEAYARLGTMKMIQDWDFDGAERAFRRALELDPDSALNRREYAVFLNSMGRFDESTAEIKNALRLEPVSVLNHRIYGMILFYSRRYDEAITQLERTIDLDPEFRGAFGFLCQAYRLNGMSDKAFECFLRSPVRKAENAAKIDAWKTIYKESGWHGVLWQTIEDARMDEKTSRLSAWDMANIYGELGERDKAFDVIEKGLGRGGWGWTVTKVNPLLDSLRNDPRYDQLLRNIGLN